MPANHNRLRALASLSVIFVVLHLAQPIVIPFMIGVLIAVGVSGVLRVSEWGVPRWAAVSLACLAAVGIGAGLGWLFFLAFDDFSTEWPVYRDALERLQVQGVRWFYRHRLGESAIALRDLEPEDAAVELALPGLALAMKIASAILLALLIAVFLLVEAAAVSSKLERMDKLGATDVSLVRETASKVQRYLWIKAATSLATGLLVGALTAIVGLEHPLLFGLLAFVLNFIPTVGSLIAMIPAVALGVLTMGWSTGLILIAGYGVINVVIGLVIEPRWEGQAAGLSPSIVVLSMVFWAFVLGPVGALLSIPLMMIVRIAAGQSEEWTWLEVLVDSPRRVPMMKNQLGVREAD